MILVLGYPSTSIAPESRNNATKPYHQNFSPCLRSDDTQHPTRSMSRDLAPNPNNDDESDSRLGQSLRFEISKRKLIKTTLVRRVSVNGIYRFVHVSSPSFCFYFFGSSFSRTFIPCASSTGPSFIFFYRTTEPTPQGRFLTRIHQTATTGSSPLNFQRLSDNNG